MLSRVRTAVTDPESFFAAEAADPRLRGPIVIVALTGLVGLLSSIPLFRMVMGQVPAGASAFVMVGLVVGSVIGLVAPFVVWLVYALLFYGLSALFGGQGKFRDVFALVGWGFAPSILSSLVGGLVMIALVSNGDVSTPQGAQKFSQAAATGPLGLANRGFGILMTLWSAWIWTYAVAAGRNLSRRNAAISVGVIVGAGILVGLATTYLL